MASSLFGSGNRGNMPLMGGNNPMNMMQQFMQFKQQMAGKDPKAMIDELVNTGKISQAQLEQFKSQAQGLMSMFGRK